MGCGVVVVGERGTGGGGGGGGGEDRGEGGKNWQNRKQNRELAEERNRGGKVFVGSARENRV